MRSRRPLNPGAPASYPAQIRRLVETTALDRGVPGWDYEYGYGIVYSQDGTIYVTGSTTSSNLSTDGTSLNGQQDAFLANVGNFMT